MKSVQLVAPRTLEPVEMPMAPDPGIGEVLVRLHAVGICGSDMHWYLEGGIGSTSAVYPQILGHEPAGVIVAVGAGVHDVHVGQRVIVEPAVTCGHCEFCRAGRHNNCAVSQFMSSPQLPGLFREYATVPAHNVVPIPDALNWTQATIIEPVAVLLHVLELAQIRVGDTVAVMGAGPIGMITANIAKVCGASKVFICDKVSHRLPLALQMGADHAVNSRENKFVDYVMDHTHGRGVDVCFDAAAATETINAAIAVTKAGGKMVLIGLPAEKELIVDLHAAMGKEIDLQMIKRSNHNAHGAIDLLESGKISDKFATHHFPLVETPKAFDVLSRYEDGVGKVVINVI